MFSLDTETTGIDFYHDSRPYLVTTYHGEGKNQFWEWEVDPLTRMPKIPPEDLQQIWDLIFQSDEEIILQNPKFDVTALATILPPFDWPWHRTQDTLLAGHLLASKAKHDLTSMAIHYLGINAQPYEDDLELACKQARRKVSSQYPEWRIANPGIPGMPSIKQATDTSSRTGESDRPWKSDTWLPRALAKELEYPEDHPWQTVASLYANSDSTLTYHLWEKMKQKLKQLDLWEIYEVRKKCLPVGYSMERTGVSVLKPHWEEVVRHAQEVSETSEQVCKNIATSYNGFDLQLPKSGSNASLQEFIYHYMHLPVLKRSLKTNVPSLDKEVLNTYRTMLPNHSKESTFIHALLNKRARDTSLSYLHSYARFWVPTSSPFHKLLHPHISPTGTDTLRWSCRNPNEQNISKKESACRKCEGEGCTSCQQTGIEARSIRYCFGPQKGREWYSCDAKNIELRIPAYLSEEEEMIALFEHPDDPPFYGSNHMLIFSILWPKLWEEACKKVGEEKAAAYCKKRYQTTEYAWTKNGNFAVQYGSIDKPDGTGTADRAYHLPGGQSRIRQRFRKQEQLNKRCIDFAQRHGFVETLPDRTVNPRRGYPLMCTYTGYGKILPTVPLNYLVQGSAMWWMMKAMIRCQEQLEEWNRQAKIKDHYRITLQVHDELVFDFPKSRYCVIQESQERQKNPQQPYRREGNLWRIRTLQRLMEMGGEKDFQIPTPTSCEYHANNWSEGVAL